MDWISVNNKRPEHSQAVLGIDDCGCYWLCYFSVVDNAFVETTDYNIVEDILFWMSLPEKPENLGVN